MAPEQPAVIPVYSNSMLIPVSSLRRLVKPVRLSHKIKSYNPLPNCSCYKHLTLNRQKSVCRGMFIFSAKSFSAAGCHGIFRCFRPCSFASPAFAGFALDARILLCRYNNKNYVTLLLYNNYFNLTSKFYEFPQKNYNIR